MHDTVRRHGAEPELAKARSAPCLPFSATLPLAPFFADARIVHHPSIALTAHNSRSSLAARTKGRDMLKGRSRTASGRPQRGEVRYPRRHLCAD